MIKEATDSKQKLINYIKRDEQQVYRYPDTIAECLQDITVGADDYAIKDDNNLNHNGYNNIWARTLIDNGVLAGYKYLKTNDGKVRLINLQDIHDIISQFIQNLK